MFWHCGVGEITTDDMGPKVFTEDLSSLGQALISMGKLEVGGTYSHRE